MTDIQDLLTYINQSPTAFHAVANARARLVEAGFAELFEEDKWDIVPGGKYFVTKNGSAFLAFHMGTENPVESGMRMVAAHTDSPCFKIKPCPEMRADGAYLKLNTAVYGGPILSTWFDRPLAVAGRVIARGSHVFNPRVILLAIDKPVLVIPNLAIHLNEELNTGYKYNPQKDTLPLAGFVDRALEKDNYLQELIAKETGLAAEEILDFDLYLYEYEKGRVMGIHDEFVSASRLDDLWMVHTGLAALCQTGQAAHTNMLLCVDHEEVGNHTLAGADSAFIRDSLERIICATGGEPADYARMAARSFAVSADLAQAVHPNYSDKHDPTLRPVLGGGMVVKYSINQKYATDGQSAAIFTDACRQANVPVQGYVNRSDIAGGSTIGNTLAAQLSVRTVDVGAPVLAMHSIRETAAVADNENSIGAFRAFYA